MIGSVKIHPFEVLKRIILALTRNSPHDTTDQILFYARLPRLILAGSVGAALAVAGLASQTLFRNPLATPSIIGVSSGSALGAVLCFILLGRSAFVTSAIMPIFSIGAGLIVTAIVFGLSNRGSFFGHSLLLAGIAISSICSAIMTALLYIAGERLQAIIFWLMGGLWQANWQSALTMLPVSLVSFLILFILAPSMNVSLVGERSAHDLGLNLRRLQRILLAVIAVATAVAVSLTGVIGFIGLVVPHLLRLVTGADHRRLLPATAIGGATLLIISDTLARSLASPAEIPVGILTSLVGAPVFLWLLNKQTKKRNL